MEYSEFIATRKTIDDVTTIEGYGYEDQYEVGTSGFLYNGDNLFIEKIGDGDYIVELFGDDYRGALADCEVELHAAAKREGVLES